MSKTFLTEYWDGQLECRMAGPTITAMNWEEAEGQAASLDVRLRVIGNLVSETYLSEDRRITLREFENLADLG